MQPIISLRKNAGMSCTQAACLVSLLLSSPTAFSAAPPPPSNGTSQPRAERFATSNRIDLVQQLWTVPVAGSPRISGLSCPVNRLPSLSLAGEIILVQDARGIRALNLQTGRSAWPDGEHDSGFLLQTDPRFEFPDRERPSFCLSGVVHGKFWTGCFIRRLVTLNLSAEGRVEWSRTPEDFQIESDGKIDFVSGPIEIPGGLAIALRESQLEEKKPRGWLVSVDPQGRTRWKTVTPPLPLATGHAVTGHVTTGQNVRDAITVSGNRIYWNQSGQRFLSLKADTGEILWQVALNQAQLERGSKCDGIAIFAESNMLIGASGKNVCAFHPADGSLLWQQRLVAPIESIPGIRQGIVVVSGECLTGLEASTGRISWQAGGTNDAGRGLGTGWILGDHILWPTRQELWTISLWNGRVLQRDALQQFTQAGGGHVLLRDQTLLIASPQQLSALQVLLRAE